MSEIKARHIKEKRLMLCDNCEGRGERRDIMALLRGHSNTKLKECESCGGTGRIVKHTETWVEPFNHKRYYEPIIS